MCEYLSKIIDIPSPAEGDSLLITIRTSKFYGETRSILEPEFEDDPSKPDIVLDFENKSKRGQEFYFWVADFFSPQKDKRYHPGMSSLNPSELWAFYKGLLNAETTINKLNSIGVNSNYTKMIEGVHNPSIFINYRSRFKGINLLLFSEGKKTYSINYNEKTLQIFIKSILLIFEQGEHLVKEMEQLSPLKIPVQMSREPVQMSSKIVKWIPALIAFFLLFLLFWYLDL